MITIYNQSGSRLYVFKGTLTNSVPDGSVAVAPWLESASITDGTNTVALTWPEFQDTRATVGVGLAVEQESAYGSTASFVLGMALGASVLAFALVLSSVRSLFNHSLE